MTETEQLHRELERVNSTLDHLVKITTIQGQSLAVQAETLKVFAEKQQDFQDTQKEMAASMAELSKAISLVQHNCDNRRGSYENLQRQVADPQNGLLVQMDRVNNKFRVFWSVVGIVGTIATLILGLVGDYIMKRMGAK